jgi:peptidoglycan/LPS O-acetylase OafA/YrhL
LLLFLLRITKNNRNGLLLATFTLIALSSVWMAVLYLPDVDPPRIYYGTDTRAAGFLVGVMLVMIWSLVRVSRAGGSRHLEVLGWAGLLALMILYNQLNEFRPFLCRGGILVTALASALLIVGAFTPDTGISNQKFAEGVKRWPQAELIDWEALAHREQAWFIKGQTHLSYAGSRSYANAIQQKLKTIP